MGDLLFDDLVRRLALAGRDERRVIERVLGRLEVGRERYGELDLGRPRDWQRERFEERLDALVYDVCEELVLEDAAQAEARGEMVDPPDVSIGLPGDHWGDPIAIDEFAPDRHATVIGGPEPYESVEIKLDDIEGKGG